MGWIASGDTLNQVRLKFPTKEEAIAYRRPQGLGIHASRTPTSAASAHATTPTISAPDRVR